MFKQEFFGRMRENPPTVQSGPVSVPCSKCKGTFIVEKKHTEVYLAESFYARQKDGTITPATPKPIAFHRLCPGCTEKLKNWFA